MAREKSLWFAANLHGMNPGKAYYPATMPVKTAPEYFAALVDDHILTEGDLGFLPGPHHSPTARTVADLSDRNIAFTVYRVGPDDSPETLFLVSKPDVFKEYWVLVRKNGTAEKIKKSAPADSVGPLPHATPPTLLP